MTVLAVLVGLLAAPLPVLAQQAAAVERHGGRPHPQKVWKPRDVKGLPSSHPVKGTPAHGTDTVTHVVSQAPVKPVWPAASTFSVTLGQAAVSGKAVASKTPATGAGNLGAAVGVTVAPAGTLATAVGGAKRAVIGSGPASVRVVVADHRAAVAAGVRGIVVQVARATDRRPPAALMSLSRTGVGRRRSAGTSPGG
ncbi:hypothetical protein [Streptacidiphilus melanogenes]|uniref:hypothetical protein n=1 Tax=Streptacidiphilus melanogenes TaxID=411235 RepID=UPI0005A8FABB|nr:hypothetical protein [Streptacidiphilus melanogenes]